VGQQQLLDSDSTVTTTGMSEKSTNGGAR
jgi:hypothetical protein